jgi:hypothetical protein
MSTVKLTSIVNFKMESGTASDLIGASSAQPVKKGIEVIMGSAPLHSDSIAERVAELSHESSPYRGLYLLYGNRDVLDERQYWSKRARKTPGAVCASVEIEFDVRGICPNHVDRKILKSFRDTDGNQIGFLNLRRIKAELQSDILVKFQDRVKAEKGNLDLMRKPANIALRPDLWPQILYEDPDFLRINVMVIAVADNRNLAEQTRQIAWVRPGTPIVSTMQSRTDVNILTPPWMTISTTKLL